MLNSEKRSWILRTLSWEVQSWEHSDRLRKWLLEDENGQYRKRLTASKKASKWIARGQW